ncbi:hypothetical protein DN730_07925 [Marinomonas piezotolerans]|uniref:Uncharacterized protein n=1 Tax=Marinomonas piezotolerans TaxID=2213058 RepID=A0A370U971_9GAMM|nr:hypothetical protein [Marinomonas piezotolerans]RDL44324.1 hypothetical protein DN730_07925 [Marinomonas piezotolerans]
MNLAEEIARWKQTGNHAHATEILHQLSKVLASTNYPTIERKHDVTVGHGSGSEIKSGLLWAVIDSHEARNRVLREKFDLLQERLKDRGQK